MLESLIRLAQGMYVYYCLFFQWEFYFISLEIKSIAVAAHARLMFRNEVTRLDAITAILCIESSMTTSAIVDSVGNALHSNFTENPDLECILFFLIISMWIYACQLCIQIWYHICCHLHKFKSIRTFKIMQLILGSCWYDSLRYDFSMSLLILWT